MYQNRAYMLTRGRLLELAMQASDLPAVMRTPIGVLARPANAQYEAAHFAFTFYPYTGLTSNFLPRNASP
jgi:hypothetical protein